ncbi:AAA family ATPase [Candidatus Binatia bacterium]|nr:AAA family ATPase [Candidatus Binatia bacterium]
MRALYPRARRIDLLTSREFVRFSQDPTVLREEVEAARDRFVVIDEVQKVPGLLDEVHWLIENRGVSFALSGSSARKVRRVHADHVKGLREFVRDHPRVGRRVVVSLDDRPRRTEDGIDVLPARIFAQQLWDGTLLAG